MFDREIAIGNLVVALTAILYLTAPFIVGDSVDPLTRLLLKWYPLVVIMFAFFVNRQFFLDLARKMVTKFFKPKTLRDLLDPNEIAGVDALLRRMTLFVSEAETLTNKEKMEVMDGQRALKRLFYSDQTHTYASRQYK